MKKIFSFFAAALMSVSMFADLTPAPDDATLNGYAEAGQNLVYAIYVADDIKCNDLVLVGTYNGWTADAASCSKFVAVEGFSGWYVCCVTDASEDIQAKPVQLDGAGAFNWDYQVGKLEQEAVVRGTATIVPGYSNECDIKAISDAAPLLINVSSWKTNPCTAVFHDYIITLVSPDCNAEEYVVPAISGGFNTWAQQAMTFNEAATYARQQQQLPGGVFTDTVRAAEGTEFKFRSSAEWGADWSNELKEYIDSTGEWGAFNGGANFVFGTTTEVEFDLGDATKYTWTSCERPTPCDSMDYVITAIFPACEAAAPNVIGSFCGWNGGVAMTLVEGNTYKATVRALCSDEFKFNDAVLGWGNEVGKFEGYEFSALGNNKFEDKDSINFDFSSEEYVWKVCMPGVTILDNTAAQLVGSKIALVEGAITWNENDADPKANTATWTQNLEIGEYAVFIKQTTGSGHKFIFTASFGGTEVGTVSEPADSWDEGEIKLEGKFTAAQAGEYTLVLSNGTQWSAANAVTVALQHFWLTKVNEINSEAAPKVKFIEDGKMYIIVNGVKYNVLGTRL